MDAQSSIPLFTGVMLATVKSSYVLKVNLIMTRTDVSDELFL